MVKAFAARLRRIADRLDPPAKPANPSPFGFRVTGLACACGQWVGPDDVHACGDRGTWSTTGTGNTFVGNGYTNPPNT